MSHKSRVASAFNFLNIAFRISSSYRFAKIVKEGDKYCVKSEKNSDWSGGCYDTKKEAEDRLAEVEMFKHMNK